MSPVKIIPHLLAVILPTLHVLSAEPGTTASNPAKPARPLTEAQMKQEKISAGTYNTMEEREKAVYEAATLDYQGLLKSMSPMKCWIAQCYLRQGETGKGLELLHSYLAALREGGDKRAAGVEEAKKKGTYKDTGFGWPRFNGFAMWGLINAYLNWNQIMDPQIKDEFKYIFTNNRSYFGSTGNLSMICTLNLYLADHCWDPALFPKDGRYGPRGPKAVPWLTNRAEYIAKNGSGEYASRPYMIYNIGTLLSLDNSFTDKELSNKARMAYDMSLAHAAGTWLRGHWATPAGRSYPDDLSQEPGGGAAMLWFYFGGQTPQLGPGSAAVFAMAEKFRPSPLIINAATDRSKPYIHRSRFDGDKIYQTSFVNKDYALFSSAVAPGTAVWGQTYGYGVMYEQPDRTKCSLLWMAVPCFDDKPLTNYTHGVATRQGQFLQNKGAFLLVGKDLKNPANGMKDRKDDTGKITNKTFLPDERYILSHIPGGAHAVINESREHGRLFFNYGSVLVAISSSEKFDWDPKSGIYSGGGNHPDDSEFRIFGENISAAMETALPEEYPGSTAEDELRAFRKDILEKTRIGIDFKPNPVRDTVNTKGSPSSDTGIVTGFYTDRFGNKLEKTFDGDARINGEIIDYISWPLVDNPWVHQERGGNMTVTDGKTVRTYDVTKWTITEQNVR